MNDITIIFNLGFHTSIVKITTPKYAYKNIEEHACHCDLEFLTFSPLRHALLFIAQRLFINIIHEHSQKVYL